MAPKAAPEPQDGLSALNLEELQQEEERLKESFKQAKIKRNFVQQERVLIRNCF